MSKRLDLKGKKFDRLLVLKQVENSRTGFSKWECQCDCGKIVFVIGTNLVKGTSKSCGCFQKEQSIRGSLKHGCSGGNITTEYKIWSGIKARCYNKQDKAYPFYGGRGIEMCDRWRYNFQFFLYDMGHRPSGLTIERRKNELGYFKENCYWATKKEQSDNRRYTVWLEYNGIKLPQADWAKKLNVTPGTIAYRLRNGEPFISIAKHFIKKYFLEI